MRVTIRDITGRSAPLTADLAGYLRSTHLRLHNSMHAETRVYTCRGVAEPFELHWNDHVVPGERLLATIGYTSREALAAVEAELAAGHAVRLFIFNSDADLCFQEQLTAE